VGQKERGKVREGERGEWERGKKRERKRKRKRKREREREGWNVTNWFARSMAENRPSLKMIN
jgi:hypothetical protein